MTSKDRERVLDALRRFNGRTFRDGIPVMPFTRGDFTAFNRAFQVLVREPATDASTVQPPIKEVSK